MKTELHTLLAVQKDTSSAATKLLEDTKNKFGKPHFFESFLKTLKMLSESSENTAIEEAARESKSLPTTVHETLEYALDVWSDAEDVIFQINQTNRIASSDLEFRGEVIVKDVPVDELLGLENRLVKVRQVMEAMPTLDASKKWGIADSGRKGEHQIVEPEVTTKTEKVTTPVVLYEATDKHPAQIEKITVDKTVGTFTRIVYSGAATTHQKAEVMSIIDELLNEVRKARSRANSVQASTDRIGKTLVNLIMSPFK